MPASGTADLPVAVDIAQGSLSVRVSVDPDLGIRPTDAPLIVAHLMKMGVVLNARGEAEIRELCRPRKSVPAAPPALVAVGTAAVDDVPAHLTLLPNIAATIFESPQVKVGDPVATLVARRIGTDGVDVFGKPIHRRQAAAQPVVDESLSPSAGGKTFHAAIDGVVRTRGEGVARTIAILPCLRHEGDMAGGSLVSPGEISVNGDVRSSTLRAGGTIHVVGDMENSTAGCDKMLTASSLRGATIDGADVVASEIFQSRISCGGEVIVESGTDDRARKRMEAILPEVEAKIARPAFRRQTPYRGVTTIQDK
jgi:hypothetical protein